MRKKIIRLILTMIMSVSLALPVFSASEDQDETEEVTVALVNGNSIT